MRDVPVANYSKMQDKYIDYLEKQLRLCGVLKPLKDKHTPEFEEWLNKFFDYKPKTYEYQGKSNYKHFTIKELVAKYEKAMLTKALMF
jgi:hypothetical protein